MWVPAEDPRFGGAKSWQSIATIGLDIAKSIFQVHGIDAAGAMLFRVVVVIRTLVAFAIVSVFRDRAQD
jgi:hypothetical protein